MDNREIYLSKEGHRKLNDELEYLKTVRKHELSRAIEQARLHGDLSENAEYDAAKEAQAMNEQRVAELEDKLARSRIIEEADIPDDKAYIGAKVTLKDLENSEEIKYILVSELEADYEQGKISIDSPVGKALLGKEVQDIVEIAVPAGTLRYEVIAVSR